MPQSASLTLGILKSLYPQSNLDIEGESFAVTCTDEEALKLVEDSVVTAGQVVNTLSILFSFV
jgi:hypothetical protein